jgi:hypothetical protein
MEAIELRSADFQFGAGRLPTRDGLRKRSGVSPGLLTDCGHFPAAGRDVVAGLLPVAADAALIARHVRIVGMGRDLKGGRWTKNWCGGVQQWRTCLSGHVWAGRLRSGWLCSPPH